MSPIPALFFRASTVITLTGGTVFLMWLGEQITSRGIGNGISLIIFSGIVAGLPRGIAADAGAWPDRPAVDVHHSRHHRDGASRSSPSSCSMERAQRRLLIQYPKRQVGNKMYQGDSSHLPLKLNTSGVIPPIFASSLLLLPITVANFTAGQGPDWLNAITAMLGHGQPLFLVLYVLLIIFFAFFYTSIMFNPKETAENLKKYGGFIPGIRPGERTAEYHRLCADAHHGDRRSLSRARLPPSRILDRLCRRAVLFRRHLAADRGERHHGYGCPDPGPSARPAI